jgi:hypothetical protein
MTSRKHKLNLGLSVLLAVVAVCYCGLFVAGLVRAPWLEEMFRPRAQSKFTQEAWRATHFGDRGRYEMANDLLRSDTLVGKTRAEIEGMLGMSDRWWQKGGNTNLFYDLGRQQEFPARCIILPSRFFWNLETWVLDIEFENNKVNLIPAVEAGI